MTDGTLPPPLPPQPEPTEPVQDEPADATPERLHAMVQSHQDTRTYPCTQCGGELEFHIGQQKLACPHCGNVQELREATGAVDEQDLASAIANLRGQRMQGAQSLVAGEKEVVCQNCGGHTTFTGTLTSTRCPYCTTPIQRDDIQAAPTRLPVDGVLPFTIDDTVAKDKLSEWVSSRWFAPREFKEYSTSGSFASVYSAYFTYDAQAITAYTGERGDDYTETVGRGENERTVTRTDWSRARGTVHNEFDDLAVPANDGLTEKFVAQLEPWPTQQVKPFSPEFVAGHLSRTYDHDVEECADRARSRMESTITSTIKQDIGGDKQRIHSQQTRWSGLTFKHLLLPIWLLTVIYDSSTYQVMINGATGVVAGERPYSKVKIATAIAAALVVIVLLVVLFSR